MLDVTNDKQASIIVINKVTRMDDNKLKYEVDFEKLKIHEIKGKCMHAQIVITI